MADSKEEKAVLRKPEDYLERNIGVLKEHGQYDTWFGTSYVQRLCRIGYNQACHTIELALERGLMESNPDKEWQYRLIKPQPLLNYYLS